MSDKHSRREVELKFRVGDPAQFDGLRAVDGRLAGRQLTPIQQKAIVDLYWETPDYALTRGGVGLRTRRVGESWIVTLKALGFDSASLTADRFELECELPQAEAEAFLAAPKLERLIAVLRQAGDLPEEWSHVPLHKKNPRLQPLAILQQEREKRYLLDGKGESATPIAELSLDTIDVISPNQHLLVLNGAGEHGESRLTPVAHFLEVELEALGDIANTDFDRIYRSLNRKRSFQPAKTSKLTSALRLAAAYTAEDTSAVHAQTMMAEACRHIWQQQLIEVMLNEYPIRTETGDPVEAVHDMRVAIRRIRAAARIFGPYFVRKEIQPYLRELRNLAGELGTARDLDVSLELIKKYEKVLGDKSGVLAAAKSNWKAQRKDAYKQLRRRLNSKAHSRFIGQFARFCNTPGLSVAAKADATAPELAAQEVRHVLPGEIFVHYANMRVYESVLHDDTPPEVFHDLRIEGKRLRYALEFVQHLLDPKPAATLITKLKAVQECLGNMNDAVVMQERLRLLSSEEPQSPSPVDAIRFLEDQIDQERRRFGELWADFVSPSTRRMLAIAVAAL